MIDYYFFISFSINQRCLGYRRSRNKNELLLVSNCNESENQSIFRSFRHDKNVLYESVKIWATYY